MTGTGSKKANRVLEKKRLQLYKIWHVTPGTFLHLDGAWFPPIETTFCSDFLHAVAKKIEKLNHGKYALLKQYNLFVYSELYIEDWMPSKILEWLHSASNRTMSYSVIYLLALNGLFWFDIKQLTYGMLETGPKLYGLGEQARAMVEEGENA